MIYKISTSLYIYIYNIYIIEVCHKEGAATEGLTLDFSGVFGLVN